MLSQSGPKVQVVTQFGVGILGEMDPKLNMVTSRGTITAIDLPLVTVSGSTTYETTDYWPGQLQVLESVAESPWSWPSGDGSVVYGHADTFPDGIPLRMSAPVAVVMNGTGTAQTFTRE